MYEYMEVHHIFHFLHEDLLFHLVSLSDVFSLHSNLTLLKLHKIYKLLKQKPKFAELILCSAANHKVFAAQFRCGFFLGFLSHVSSPT